MAIFNSYVKLPEGRISECDGPWRTLDQLISWVSNGFQDVYPAVQTPLALKLFALKMQRRSTRRFPIRLNPNVFLWIRTSSGSSGDNISSYQLISAPLFQSVPIPFGQFGPCPCAMPLSHRSGNDLWWWSLEPFGSAPQAVSRQCPQCPATEDPISPKPFLQPNRFQTDSK